jgi:hypothetical protein
MESRKFNRLKQPGIVENEEGFGASPKRKFLSV